MVSNGTPVLGLGNIGRWPGKPVMEGKGCLFKKFAGIVDVFDIEVDDKTDPDKLVKSAAGVGLRRESTCAPPPRSRAPLRRRPPALRRGSVPAPAAVRTLPELRASVAAWRREGLRVGLVPTMGALHDGHLALMRARAARADRVVVVDLRQPDPVRAGRGPRPLPARRARRPRPLAGVGVRSGLRCRRSRRCTRRAIATRVDGRGARPRGSRRRRRPHFFRGVATVVAKLLNQVRPDVAVFGEKDYQQLLVVRRLARDLAIPAEIVAYPTVREPDGLALSSRNRYLPPAERASRRCSASGAAEAARTLADGRAAAEALAAGARRLLAAGFTRVDYLELRDAEDLAPLDHVGERPARLLAAALLGGTRLIDNVPVRRL